MPALPGPLKEASPELPVEGGLPIEMGQGNGLAATGRKGSEQEYGEVPHRLHSIRFWRQRHNRSLA